MSEPEQVLASQVGGADDADVRAEFGQSDFGDRPVCASGQAVLERGCGRGPK